MYYHAWGFVGSGDGSSHPDSALLRKNVAFTTFIITDTISLVLSSFAVFIYLLMSFLFGEDFDKDKLEKVLYIALRFILWAMITMVLAFVTGTCICCVSAFLGSCYCQLYHWHNLLRYPHFGVSKICYQLLLRYHSFFTWNKKLELNICKESF
jgi:hypothetical protein